MLQVFFAGLLLGRLIEKIIAGIAGGIVAAGCVSQKSHSQKKSVNAKTNVKNSHISTEKNSSVRGGIYYYTSCLAYNIIEFELKRDIQNPFVMKRIKDKCEYMAEEIFKRFKQHLNKVGPQKFFLDYKEHLESSKGINEIEELIRELKKYGIDITTPITICNARNERVEFCCGMSIYNFCKETIITKLENILIEKAGYVKPTERFYNVNPVTEAGYNIEPTHIEPMLQVRPIHNGSLLEGVR